MQPRSLNLTFKTVYNAKVKLMMASSKDGRIEWPFLQNGAETIYTAVVKVSLLSFEICFEVTYWSKWTVSRKKETVELDALRYKNFFVLNNTLLT